MLTLKIKKCQTKMDNKEKNTWKFITMKKKFVESFN